MIKLLKFLEGKILIRYLIAGSTAASVDLLFLHLFTDFFGIWYVFSSVLAFIIAFFVSFFLQKYWTFKNKENKSRGKQMVYYFLIALMNLLLNSLGMYLIVEGTHLHYLIAQIFMGMAIAVESFIIYQIFVFKTPKTDKPKILIATGLYPPEIGGPATYSKLLEDELPRRGVDVVMLPFAHVRKFPRIIRHFLYMTMVFEKANRVNIVYAQDPVSVGLPAMLVSRLLRKPYLLKIVGDYAWEQYSLKNKWVDIINFQKGYFGFSSMLRKMIERFVARHANKIVVPSEYLKKVVIHWGVKEENIIVVYNSFEKPNFSLTKKEARNKYNLQGFSIITAGRLVPWKGFLGLIKAMPEIIKFNPSANLYILGDGPERESLEDESHKLRLKDKIFFTGRVSHLDVLGYFKGGDVFVLNTAYEGLSHVILESLAMGIPIVTTNIGGNPEVIREGVDGLLFPPNNGNELLGAIQKLIQDENLRNIFSISGAERLNIFSKEAMLNKLTSVIKNL